MSKWGYKNGGYVSPCGKHMVLLSADRYGYSMVTNDECKVLSMSELKNWIFLGQAEYPFSRFDLQEVYIEREIRKKRVQHDTKERLAKKAARKTNPQRLVPRQSRPLGSETVLDNQ